MSSTERVALVFGASGISGWAITRELLRYPDATTFSKVIALSNRPLDPAVTLLSDPRLTYAHGVDLTQPVESVVKALKEKVPDIGKVTNVFWYGKRIIPTTLHQEKGLRWWDSVHSQA